MNEAKIIAEVGSNWQSLDDLLQSISQAKRSGADYCKLQAYSHKMLYGYEDASSPLNKHSLPLEWLPRLKEKADECFSQLMCTAFDIETLKYLDPFVSAHKIASSDSTYTDLIDTALATGKELYLSLGATSIAEIEFLMECYKGKKEQIVWMYCNAAYPSRYHDLRVIDFLRTKYDIRVGYSDHSLDVIYAPYMAVRFHGAVALEKHINFVSADSPDSPHSISGKEFGHMVKAIRSESMDILLPSPEELAMLTLHNRRLMATQELPQGTALEYGKNIGAFRSKMPCIGFPAYKSDMIRGRTAKRDIPAFTPITSEDLC